MTTPLKGFPDALRRLILCGGGGLPPAWGPVLDADGSACAWNPYRQEVFDSGDYTTSDPTGEADRWSIPLDAESPWPARLATVAAWMLGMHHTTYANVYAHQDQALYFVASPLLFSSSEPLVCHWYQAHGWRSCLNVRWLAHGIACPTLTSLRLDLHPPSVALLLALYDVPEIKARVAAVVL